MANGVYAKALQAALAGDLDLEVATVRAVLLRNYTANLAAHTFLADVTSTAAGGGGGQVVSTTAPLAGKTVTDGVFDADDTLFAAVPVGTACQAVVYVQSSAPGGGADLAAAGQRLISFHDTGPGLPVTPNGVDITLIHSNTADRIARI